MIDADLFIRNSPFQMNHNDSSNSYNLSNTTPDLLKFQLQEQYRNKLNELKSDAPSGEFHLLNTQFLEDSFNSHLQSNLDSGNITLNESIPSLTSSSTEEEDDFEIDSFISSSANKPNYINLKVLIENSILDTAKINKDSILSLASLKSLKLAIQEKSELQQYLVSKVTISQQFTSTILLKQPDEEELDAALLLKILKSNASLQDQLLSINAELDSLTLQLNNHNLACLVLGYVEDVRLSSANKDSLSSGSSHSTIPKGVPNGPISSPFNSPRRLTSSTSPRKAVSSEAILKSFDSMFSHIASIAAQRNITLPTPPSPSVSQSDTIQARTNWAQECIDAVLSNTELNQQTAPTTAQASLASFPEQVRTPDVEKTFGSLSNTPTSKRDALNDSSFFSSNSPSRANVTPADKIIAEYKTALNDLRFSHQYLTKEYEISRESSMKLIQEYRKRITQLEKEVQLQSVKENMVSSESGDSSSKDKEIFKLRKELNLLKIDKIGTKSNGGSSSQLLLTSPRLAQGSYDSPILSSSSAFPANAELRTSISPITGEQLNIPADSLNEDDDSHSITSGLSSTRPTSVNGFSTSSGGMSNGILRKEFKKIVSDIQDQHEVELSEERIKRRNLQLEIERLKSQLE